MSTEAERRELVAASAQKLSRLRARLRGLGGALVAFSGGADSALVLKVATDELGDRAVALTAVSASLPPREREAAAAFAQSLGVRHLLVESRELDDPRYAANPVDRCYYCKAELYALCEQRARELDLPVILDGFNADDRRELRPGQRAALERSVVSPLAEAELGKDEIRAQSWALGLVTWDKPQLACLSSRLPTGTPVTVERLGAVGGAEEDLRALGFRQLRVRHHGEVARIELAEDELVRLADPELRERMAQAVKRRGFRFVSVDLEPFASGRLARR
ncbi:MAG: ATP-dependent sacrificial sulfur transferase LarE [Deltaproteobacteria bacterium]